MKISTIVEFLLNSILQSKCLWLSDKMMLFVNDNCDDYDWVILENQLT